MARRTSRTASRASRTSRRSRARWRWSPRRGCAAPSSASKHLRPYAEAIRRMTRQAAEAAPERPQPADPPRARVGAERRAAARHRRPRPRRRLQLADHPRRHPRRRRAPRPAAATVRCYASGRRGVSSLTFRGREPRRHLHRASPTGPAYADAREIAEDLMAAYVDGKVDRVEIIYNRYISPLTQTVRRETLLPLQQASILGEDDAGGGGRGRRQSTGRWSSTSPTPRRSSSASSPTTSRSRSTARCSSPPPPSTARA